MRDLTKGYDYARLVAEEQQHYSGIEVTESLLEGGVHAHASWYHYWSRVYADMRAAGGEEAATYVERASRGLDRPLRILSLGSGYCGQEIMLAARIATPYEITCTDLNPALFDQAAAVAKARGLHLRFASMDMNFAEIETGRYDLILAHAALHHVINLETLFEQVARGLTPTGLFHVVEVVGQNRKLLWPENARFANRALRLVPRAVRGFTRVRVPRHVEGMEGVRQEDIVPLMRRSFTPVFEHAHGAYMRFICTHPRLGRAFDPAHPERRRYLDLLIDLDASAVRQGVLRPLEIWGVYRPRDVAGVARPGSARIHTSD